MNNLLMRKILVTTALSSFLCFTVSNPSMESRAEALATDMKFAGEEYKTLFQNDDSKVISGMKNHDKSESQAHVLEFEEIKKKPTEDVEKHAEDVRKTMDLVVSDDIQPIEIFEGVPLDVNIFSLSKEQVVQIRKDSGVPENSINLTDAFIERLKEFIRLSQENNLNMNFQFSYDFGHDVEATEEEDGTIHHRHKTAMINLRDWELVFSLKDKAEDISKNMNLVPSQLNVQASPENGLSIFWQNFVTMKPEPIFSESSECDKNAVHKAYDKNTQKNSEKKQKTNQVAESSEQKNQDHTVTAGNVVMSDAPENMESDDIKKDIIATQPITQGAYLITPSVLDKTKGSKTSEKMQIMNSYSTNHLGVSMKSMACSSILVDQDLNVDDIYGQMCGLHAVPIKLSGGDIITPVPLDESLIPAKDTTETVFDSDAGDVQGDAYLQSRYVAFGDIYNREIDEDLKDPLWFGNYVIHKQRKYNVSHFMRLSHGFDAVLEQTKHSLNNAYHSQMQLTSLPEIPVEKHGKPILSSNLVQYFSDYPDGYMDRINQSLFAVADVFFKLLHASILETKYKVVHTGMRWDTVQKYEKQKRNLYENVKKQIDYAKDEFTNRINSSKNIINDKIGRYSDFVFIKASEITKILNENDDSKVLNRDEMTEEQAMHYDNLLSMHKILDRINNAKSNANKFLLDWYTMFQEVLNANEQALATWLDTSIKGRFSEGKDLENFKKYQCSIRYSSTSVSKPAVECLSEQSLIPASNKSEEELETELALAKKRVMESSSCLLLGPADKGREEYFRCLNHKFVQSGIIFPSHLEGTLETLWRYGFEILDLHTEYLKRFNVKVVKTDRNKMGKEYSLIFDTNMTLEEVIEEMQGDEAVVESSGGYIKLFIGDKEPAVCQLGDPWCVASFIQENHEMIAKGDKFVITVHTTTATDETAEADKALHEDDAEKETTDELDGEMSEQSAVEEKAESKKTDTTEEAAKKDTTVKKESEKTDVSEADTTKEPVQKEEDQVAAAENRKAMSEQANVIDRTLRKDQEFRDKKIMHERVMMNLMHFSSLTEIMNQRDGIVLATSSFTGGTSRAFVPNIDVINKSVFSAAVIDGSRSQALFNRLGMTTSISDDLNMTANFYISNYDRDKVSMNVGGSYRITDRWSAGFLLSYGQLGSGVEVDAKSPSVLTGYFRSSYTIDLSGPAKLSTGIHAIFDDEGGSVGGSLTLLDFGSSLFHNFYLTLSGLAGHDFRVDKPYVGLNLSLRTTVMGSIKTDLYGSVYDYGGVNMYSMGIGFSFTI